MVSVLLMKASAFFVNEPVSNFQYFSINMRKEASKKGSFENAKYKCEEMFLNLTR